MLNTRRRPYRSAARPARISDPPKVRAYSDITYCNSPCDEHQRVLVASVLEGTPPAERADAARNRAKILATAEQLGEPPLGPGAPATERIHAFLHAYVDVLDTYGTLMAAAEATMSSTRRYGTGPYAVHHQHLADLIGQAHPDADAHYLADALLAPLSAGLFTYHRDELGVSIHRIMSGLDQLLEGLHDHH